MTLAEHLARLYRVTFRPHRRAYLAKMKSGVDCAWGWRDFEQDIAIDTRLALYQNRLYGYRMARLDALWDRHLPEIKADLLRDNDALLDFSFDPIGRG